MGICNSGYQTILDRIFLAPNYPLRQPKYSDLPPGELAVGSNRLRSEFVPRDGLLLSEYQLIYYTEQDTEIVICADRVYRLLKLERKGSNKGIEITDLRNKLDIEKMAKKNPNKSSIKIYNLAKHTREEMEKPGTRCVLYAGYKDQDGPQLIFQA